MERGKFVVIEGVDASGKSSSLQKALSMIDTANIQTVKGFNHTTVWEKCIDRHPHSILYYLDLLQKNYALVQPCLKQGKHVIQDRYKQTVDTYEPDAGFLINRLFRIIADPWFLQPDIYIQFLANIETLLSRLSEENKKQSNPYHLMLINNPNHLERRQQRYREIYNGLQCHKYLIDTSEKTVEESAEKLISIFAKEEIC